MNHYKKANEVFNEIIKIEPTNKTRLIKFGKNQFEYRKFEQSEHFYKTILENDQNFKLYLFFIKNK